MASDGALFPGVKRRLLLGWAAFGKVYNIIRSPKSTIETKRKLFNEYLLPVITYGSETWALKNTSTETLAVAQRKMKRIVLGMRGRETPEFDSRSE